MAKQGFIEGAIVEDKELESVQMRLTVRINGLALSRTFTIREDNYLATSEDDLRAAFAIAKKLKLDPTLDRIETKITRDGWDIKR